MTAQAQRGFVDSIAARLLALCIAIGLSAILFFNYQDDIERLVSGTPSSGLPVTNADTSPDQASNPELARCLQQRIGDVDRMKKEGVLSDTQYEAFRSRAENLCIQQNPS
ncbi:MAG: hypothetical protein JJ891_08785 [Rhizobiaceae bacterium]|nr:hypothetical protein [Rhizobiaceae bacterium]